MQEIDKSLYHLKRKRLLEKFLLMMIYYKFYNH